MRLDVKVFKTQCKQANLYSADKKNIQKRCRKERLSPRERKQNTHNT